MSKVVDILILGYRNGLGPELKHSFPKSLKVVYMPMISDIGVSGIDTTILDEYIGQDTIVIYCHVLFSLSGIIKKKIARHNIRLLEQVVDAMHDRRYSRFIFISHLLAPTLQEIQEASTQNEDPPTMVKGLQKLEQLIHRMIAEGHNVQIIRIPFVGHSSENDHLGKIAASSLDKISRQIPPYCLDLSAKETITKTDFTALVKSKSVEEFHSTELKFFSPSLLERVDKLFSKNDSL